MSIGYLRSLVDCWEQQLKTAREQKKKDFGAAADRLWGFYTKNYRELYYIGEDTGEPDLSFATREQQGDWYLHRTAKCREFVNIVLPYVHAKIPHRLVTPSRPQLPGELAELAESIVAASQQDPRIKVPQEITWLKAGLSSQALHSVGEKIVSWFLTWYLNYIPKEYGAKREQRTAIQECLVKGRSVVWHEIIQGPGGLLPCSRYDSVDGLFIDPEAKRWHEAGFVIREREWPAWRLSQTFGIDLEDIRSTGSKATGKGGVPSSQTDRDIYPWFEVHSVIGMGQRLHKAGDNLRDPEQARLDAVQMVEPNVYLAFLPGLDYPLNIKPELWEKGTAEEVAHAIKWSVATYKDKANPFPCTPMDIYPSTEDPWAVSPLQAGLIYQVFLDKIYGFLMNRIRQTSRDLIFTANSLRVAVDEAIHSGFDQQVVGVETEQLAQIEKLVHIMQFQPVQKDVWPIIELIGREFEIATGMDPLLSGGQTSKQMRSSREAGIREAGVTNRPNDYADAVEEFNSQVAKVEGQLTRLYIRAPHIAPLFREPVPEPQEDPNGFQFGPLSMLWNQFVNVDSPGEAFSDLHYSIEAGSGRRKNKQAQTENFQQALQIFGPMAAQLVEKGYNAPWNELADMAGEVYDAPFGRMKIPNLVPQSGGEQGEAGEQPRQEM